MAKQLSFELDPEEGAFLVGFARSSIEAALAGGEPPSLEDVSEKLRTDCGVFVTLNKVSGSSHSLRGCIGYPYPVMPLVDAVSEAAVSAALRDPRFQPVSLEEMDSVAVVKNCPVFLRGIIYTAIDCFLERETILNNPRILQSLLDH